jgi:hypothetical protein
MPPIGATFLEELRTKEVATGLTLLEPGVSWTEQGLDPLPPRLTAAQVAAIQQVVAAHDSARPKPKTPREQAKDALETALGQVQGGPIATALNALKTLTQ